MTDFGDNKNVSDGQGRALGWEADDLDSPLDFITYLSDLGQVHLPRQPGFVVLYISRICSQTMYTKPLKRICKMCLPFSILQL